MTAPKLPYSEPTDPGEIEFLRLVRALPPKHRKMFASVARARLEGNASVERQALMRFLDARGCGNSALVVDEWMRTGTAP